MATWPTLSRLCRELLARDRAERAALLNKVCGEDKVLRQLLSACVLECEHHETAGSFAELDDLLGALARASEERRDTGEGGANPQSHSLDGLEDLLAALTTSTRQTWDPASDTAASIPDHAADPSVFPTSSPLTGLSPRTLVELLAAMEPCDFAAGDYLMRQGEAGDFLLLVLHGTAWARLRNAPAGRPPVGVFGPGDIVGEIALVTNEPRTADVVARTAVRAQRLSASAFQAIADRHPDLLVMLTEIVGSRLGRARYDGLGGKDIHGYRIQHCIGRGGMGVVYEAEEIAGGRTVALKMMNHRLIYHPRAVRRFKREAAILKTLQHPALATLYECFSAYRTEFLAMEFCRGWTLSAALKETRRLPESVVRPLIGQLADALRYVHRRGVVHRDVKPSNVMLCDSAALKLLDFGIGRFDDITDQDTRSASPQSADWLGTPRYMAPEQFSNATIDHRVDFYGLACVAFEALSGGPVIKASHLLGIVLEQSTFELPARDRIGGGISEEMHQMLAKGLQYDREQRTLDLDAIAAWAGPVNVRPATATPAARQE